MSMQIEGMMSPQQAALRQAEGQLQIESLLETITAESQKLADAAQGPNIMPGTGGKTPGMLMQEQQAKLEAQNTVQKIAAATDWENLAVTLGQDIAALAHRQRAVTDKIVKDSKTIQEIKPKIVEKNQKLTPISELFQPVTNMAEI